MLEGCKVMKGESCNFRNREIRNICRRSRRRWHQTTSGAIGEFNIPVSPPFLSKEEYEYQLARSFFNEFNHLSSIFSGSRIKAKGE